MLRGLLTSRHILMGLNTYITHDTLIFNGMLVELSIPWFIIVRSSTVSASSEYYKLRRKSQ